VQLTGRTLSDHIVVFEGNERLVGQTVAVAVTEATAYTLFGSVVTGVQVGVEHEREGLPDQEEAGTCGAEFPAQAGRRFGLRLV
jgi:tRNA-2-methylthio-N6-dimethylallyladenosine synthase